MPSPSTGHADAGSIGNAGESAGPKNAREWAWSGESEVTNYQCPHQNTVVPPPRPRPPEPLDPSDENGRKDSVPAGVARTTCRSGGDRAGTP